MRKSSRPPGLISDKIYKNMPEYVCSSCGYGSASWYGKCPQCSEWNTIIKTEDPASKDGIMEAKFVELSKITSRDRKRKKTEIFEFDRVLGGGFVPGEVILLGGEPGIGKSTLLLNSLKNLETIYVSGEESGQQIKHRADRIKTPLGKFLFSETTQIEAVIAGLKDKISKFDVLVIDSIQTVYSKEVPSPAGSVSQLKQVTIKLTEFAKKNNICLILIGHITKGGEIAGPKTLEHLVDCVLYLEGEKLSNFRILRSHKNRFGPTDEVGIFEMGQTGMQEVTNPTVFLDERKMNTVGSAIVGVLEGTRSLFFEVQTLLVSTSLAVPRRVARGVDYNKIQLLLAVLRKNLNLAVDRFDVYVSLAGGVSIKSTAADLGIAASIVSSIRNQSLPSKSIFIGEIGLLGEVRKVLNEEKIIKEAQRFKFSKIFSSKNIKSVKEILQFFK